MLSAKNKKKSSDANKQSKSKSSSNSNQNNSGSKQKKSIVVTPEVLKEEGYTLHELLGEGAYSKVYRATNSKTPGIDYACKQYKVNAKTIKWVDRCLAREMKLSLTVRHRAIVEAYTAVKVGDEAFLVLQFAANGSVRDYLRHKLEPKEYLSERKVHSWSSDIFSAVAYLHGHDIAHRDIKTDNFLLTKEMKPLLADFSFACISDRPDSRFDCMVDTVCGTAVYMAPELHLMKSGQRYDGKSADVYALGISLYEMLVKVVPYRGQYLLCDPKLIRRQTALDYTYPEGIRISEQCRQLIRILLEPNQRKRPSINRVLLMPWFTEPTAAFGDLKCRSKNSRTMPTTSNLNFRRQSTQIRQKDELLKSSVSKSSKSIKSGNSIKTQNQNDKRSMKKKTPMSPVAEDSDVGD